ncbi:Cupin domain protein [Geosporobacter subterraneus DSM 17957]|uniref:Cupin domain protein n=1 Tax=Geosporobacter subterraneus DSM 17957 TaxID=1121919 RepID=A0A1M6DMA7_9FIRM|nr:cupin domain-containing protein [Geosporobacter subterraneus]SHI74128.1 Cupin domain protein [Geosporobacter subterraneus DSM 17957]
MYLDSTFTKRVLFSEEKVSNFVLNTRSGQQIPPHQHEDIDLILHVLKGGAELTVDGKTQENAAGDVIYCKGHETFSLKNNTCSDMSCFVVLAPRPGPKIYVDEIGNQ